jgi:hypothetical protein
MHWTINLFTGGHDPNHPSIEELIRALAMKIVAGLRPCCWRKFHSMAQSASLFGSKSLGKQTAENVKSSCKLQEMLKLFHSISTPPSGVGHIVGSIQFCPVRFLTSKTWFFPHPAKQWRLVTLFALHQATFANFRLIEGLGCGCCDLRAWIQMLEAWIYFARV